MNYTRGISLEKIRDELIRMEDTIIFALIERAQFATNADIYSTTKFTQLKTSFLIHVLHDVECVYSKVRRYSSPEEHAFTSNLPQPILPPMTFPSILAPNNVNYNTQIMNIYLNNVVPRLTKHGDDNNYGSSAIKDIEVLQALSRRIHFGLFVAEAKFIDPINHDEYCVLIKAGDRQGLLALLTNSGVERRLLERLKRKAEIYGQDITFSSILNDQTPIMQSSQRICPALVCEMYEQYIIPLTKEVEVDYLLLRLDTNFVASKLD